MSVHFVCRLIVFLTPLSVFGSAIMAAQEPTIPERLVQAGTSLTGGTTVPSGPAPAIDAILRQTDAVIRGTVVESGSYLSADKREVYTDYRVENPRYLYERKALSSNRPGAQAAPIVTLVGGTVTIGALTFKSVHEALPQLERGREYLLFLRQVGGKYEIAGRYYGAFDTTGGALRPAARKQGFAAEYRGTPANKATDELLSRIRALKR